MSLDVETPHVLLPLSMAPQTHPPNSRQRKECFFDTVEVAGGSVSMKMQEGLGIHGQLGKEGVTWARKTGAYWG